MHFSNRRLIIYCKNNVTNLFRASNRETDASQLRIHSAMDFTVANVCRADFPGSGDRREAEHSDERQTS
jgi:hypothetical protein